ncbi:myb-like protein X [Perilla frutescens var. frutescens]|nr:myb-like protein X [Perilla frutescens var. frutescens]
MSRCFPFPPPGYELKARLDDVNVIIKDKQNHKKHKDKKEKDKKERSERKEKERSEDKHKDDKKRKRKEHKDKKDKHKDKQSSSVEEKSVGFLVNENGLKHVPQSKPNDGIPDERTVVELANRVRNNDGATSNHMVQKITIVEKERANLLGKVLENGNGMVAIKEKRDYSRMANVQSADKVEKRNGGKETNGNTVVEGDGSKNEDQNKKTKAEDKKRKKEKKKEKKEKKKEKKEKKKELMGFSKEKFIKQETSDGNFLDFHSNIPSDLLKENDDCRGKLPKLKELNGLLHAKDNGVRPNNMSRPVVVSHQAGQTGSGVHPSQNTINLGVGKSVVITDQKVNGNGKLSSPQSVIDNVRNIGPCHTTNKAKMKNGMVSINDHAMSNGVISPHIIHIERKMEPCQTSNSVAVVKKIINPSGDGKIPPPRSFVENGGKMAVQAPDVMHNKELRMNGSSQCKNHSSSMLLPSVSLKRKEKVATAMKSPHPDLRYLSQILTVPELVEWPQCDDQEWLFDQTKRRKLASPEIQWTKQVWSEAVELESAEVTALPYVIPY